MFGVGVHSTTGLAVCLGAYHFVGWTPLWDDDSSCGALDFDARENWFLIVVSSCGVSILCLHSYILSVSTMCHGAYHVVWGGFLFGMTAAFMGAALVLMHQLVLGCVLFHRILSSHKVLTLSRTLCLLGFSLFGQYLVSLCTICASIGRFFVWRYDLSRTRQMQEKMMTIRMERWHQAAQRRRQLGGENKQKSDGLGEGDNGGDDEDDEFGIEEDIDDIEVPRWGTKDAIMFFMNFTRDLCTVEFVELRPRPHLRCLL